MELPYILSNKAFLIFEERELFKKTSYISGGNFTSTKYFLKLSIPKKKFFLYFTKELAKPENQFFLYFF